MNRTALRVMVHARAFWICILIYSSAAAFLVATGLLLLAAVAAIGTVGAVWMLYRGVADDLEYQAWLTTVTTRQPKHSISI